MVWSASATDISPSITALASRSPIPGCSSRKRLIATILSGTCPPLPETTGGLTLDVE
jgi:hypothetical protein